MLGCQLLNYAPGQHDACAPRAELEHVPKIKAHFIQAVLYTVFCCSLSLANFAEVL